MSARRVPFAHNVAVSSGIDERIDDLYKGPLGDFTASRNALAKTLTREEAGRIRALRKPTLVAWAVNQLYWRASKTYERLLDRGARLRKAQIAALSGKSDADALREASDAHRAAIAEAARETMRIAGIGAQHAEPLTRTLEALSLASEPPETPGRLTDVLQPAGFEALAGVTPKKAPEPSKKQRQAAKQEAADARKREAEIRKAEAALERARAAETLARRSLERASRARADAEARLAKLR